jgi:primosomal protein N' (replication factor Y)
VVVPFGRRQLTGWVDELEGDPDSVPAKIRDIIDAPDPAPVLDAEMLELCRWVSSYYVAPGAPSRHKGLHSLAIGTGAP